MTCGVCDELIVAYMDGESPDALDAHALICPESARHRADTDQLLAALSLLPRPEPPVGLAQRIVHAVRKDFRQRKQARQLRWMAPLVLTTVAGLFFTFGIVFLTPDITRPATPEPIAIQEGVNQARDEVASLTIRTAQETARLFPHVEVSNLVPPQMPEQGSPLQPFREAGEIVSSGLQPLTDPACRAMSLFFRDLPVDAR